jgi:hypothetical protein
MRRVLRGCKGRKEGGRGRGREDVHGVLRRREEVGRRGVLGGRRRAREGRRERGGRLVSIRTEETSRRGSMRRTDGKKSPRRKKRIGRAEGGLYIDTRAVGRGGRGGGREGGREMRPGRVGKSALEGA